MEAKAANPPPVDAEAKPLIGQLTKTRAHQFLLRPDESPTHVHLILDGWVVRYVNLVDGRRQINGIHVAGDICDLGWLDENRSAQPVLALTDVHSARVDVSYLREQAARNPQLLRALFDETRANFDMQSEWALSLGRRSALERIGHFFCELFSRLGAVNLVRGDSCDMPLTQAEIADYAGLTPVHTNRTLQELRAMGLIELQARRLRIPDFGRLASLAMFSIDYLRRTRPFRTNDLVEIRRT